MARVPRPVSATAAVVSSVAPVTPVLMYMLRSRQALDAKVLYLYFLLYTIKFGKRVFSLWTLGTIGAS